MLASPENQQMHHATHRMPVSGLWVMWYQSDLTQEQCTGGQVFQPTCSRFPGSSATLKSCSRKGDRTSEVPLWKKVLVCWWEIPQLEQSLVPVLLLWLWLWLLPDFWSRCWRNWLTFGWVFSAIRVLTLSLAQFLLSCLGPALSILFSPSLLPF